jgi:hypothetical protein
MNDSALLNFSNGLIPGFLYDYDSGALFKFPDVVVIDFAGIKPKPSPLPAYQRLLNENPMLMDFEEFRPGEGYLQSDRYSPVPQPQIIDRSQLGGTDVIGTVQSSGGGSGGSGGQSTGSGGDSTAPVTIYPVE